MRLSRAEGIEEEEKEKREEKEKKLSRAEGIEFWAQGSGLGASRFTLPFGITLRTHQCLLLPMQMRYRYIAAGTR